MKSSTSAPTPPEEPSVDLGPRPAGAGPVLLLAAVGLLSIPPAVFAVVGLSEGMGMAGTVAAVVEQYRVRRLNLFTVAVLSLAPLLLLALLIVVIRRFTSIRASPRSLALGGALAIAAVMIWVNAQFWPVFLPDRVAPGFPHGLEFVIGPIYFAPVAMVVGLALAALAGRRAG